MAARQTTPIRASEREPESPSLSGLVWPSPQQMAPWLLGLLRNVSVVQANLIVPPSPLTENSPETVAMRPRIRDDVRHWNLAAPDKHAA